MSQQRNRSRGKTCLLTIIILMCLVILVGIFLTKFVTNQAEHIVGTPSPEINPTQRLYLSVLILLQSDALTRPTNPEAAEIKTTIDQGESVPSIIGKLWEAGLISNPGVFRSYLQFTGLDTRLQAGEYYLSPSMSAIEIATTMQSSISRSEERRVGKECRSRWSP